MDAQAVYAARSSKPASAHNEKLQGKQAEDLDLDGWYNPEDVIYEDDSSVRPSELCYEQMYSGLRWRKLVLAHISSAYAMRFLEEMDASVQDIAIALVNGDEEVWDSAYDEFMIHSSDLGGPPESLKHFEFVRLHQLLGTSEAKDILAWDRRGLQIEKDRLQREK